MVRKNGASVSFVRSLQMEVFRLDGGAGAVKGGHKMGGSLMMKWQGIWVGGTRLLTTYPYSGITAMMFAVRYADQGVENRITLPRNPCAISSATTGPNGLKSTFAGITTRCGTRL